MAVNRKGKGVNTIDEADDFGLADLGRLEEQYATEPAAFREMRLRARKARTGIDAINAIEEGQPGSIANPKLPWGKELFNYQKVKASLEPRMALYKESTRERINAQAVNVVGREMSERSINSYIHSNSNSLESQAGGMNAASQGYNSLAERRGNIMNEIQGLRQSSMAAAGGYIGNHGVNAPNQGTIQENAGRMKELAQQLVPITLGMQQLKQQGLDPEGQKRSLINMGDKASGVLSYNKLEDEMRSGKGLGALSDKDLRKKEAESAEKLIKALDELRNSAGKTKDELEALNKNAQDASKEFEEMSEARSIGGARQGDSGAKVGAAYLSAVANVANLVGNTIQTMAINQPMQQMGNIGGYANLENQKYDMWKAGNEGNMTERMNMAGWGNAGEFGKQMANRAGWVVGSRIVGGVAATAAGGAQTFDAVTSAAQGTGVSKLGLKDATAVQQVAGGIQATGEGIAMTLIQGNDAVKKLSTSQAELQGNLAAMGTTKQLNHISGYQAQQYRDHLMGLRGSAMQMGAERGGEFIDQVGGSAFMDRMAGVGLGSAEMGRLSQFGAQNMGSMFSADQAIKAKHYENLGLGSAQENMQRMGTFAGAGSQNPMQSMEKVMERAVGAGFKDSSKALTIIADNTGQMVERSNMAGSGFDTSDIVSKLILGAVDKSNTNKEFAATMAAGTYKTEEDIKTNTSTSFAGRMSTKRLQLDLGLDYKSSLAMQSTSTDMWRSWQEQAKNGKMDEVKQQMWNKGINYETSELFKKDPQAWFKKLSEDKVLTQVERGGSGWASGATEDFAMLQAWANKSKENQKIFMGQDAAGELKAPAEIRQALLKLNQNVTLSDPTKSALASRADLGVSMGFGDINTSTLPKEGAAPQNAFGLVQEDASLGDRQRIAAAKQGAQVLGAGKEFSGTTGASGVTASGRVNQALPGQNAEAKFAEAAAKSAADFGASAIKLDNASGKLVEAANKLIAFAGANKMNTEDFDTKRKIKELEEKLPDLPGASQTERVDGGSR